MSGEDLKLEPWQEAANVVHGAYKLSLSSAQVPTHPRNLAYHKRFSEDPLRYAVLLLERIERQEREIDGMREALDMWCEAWDNDDGLDLKTEMERYYKAREASEALRSMGKGE